MSPSPGTFFIDTQSRFLAARLSLLGEHRLFLLLTEPTAVNKMKITLEA
jgi:hypothetical protein